MRAFLIVDIQNDFLPGGSLPVERGDQIIPVINELQHKFSCVVASKDWHPPNHISFASYHGKQVGETIQTREGTQILWPDHCIQETPGGAFPEHLNTEKIEKVFFKGIDPGIDSYSAFFDNAHIRCTGLGDYLRSKGVDEIVIAGLTTEYCVKYSALDAIQLGFKAIIVEDACLGVNLHPEDTEHALAQIKQAGAQILKSHQI